MKAYSWLITALVACTFHTSVSADNFTDGDFSTHTSAWRSITNGAYDSSPDEHCLDDKSLFLEQASAQDTSSSVTNAVRHTVKKYFDELCDSKSAGRVLLLRSTTPGTLSSYIDCFAPLIRDF